MAYKSGKFLAQILVFVLSLRRSKNSFNHKKEEGYEHQIEMKTGIKPPEDLISWTDILHQFGDFLPKNIKTLPMYNIIIL